MERQERSSSAAGSLHLRSKCRVAQVWRAASEEVGGAMPRRVPCPFLGGRPVKRAAEGTVEGARRADVWEMLPPADLRGGTDSLCIGRWSGGTTVRMNEGWLKGLEPNCDSSLAWVRAGWGGKEQIPGGMKRRGKH